MKKVLRALVAAALLCTSLGTVAAPAAVANVGNYTRCNTEISHAYDAFGNPTGDGHGFDNSGYNGGSINNTGVSANITPLRNTSTTGFRVCTNHDILAPGPANVMARVMIVPKSTPRDTNCDSTASNGSHSPLGGCQLSLGIVEGAVWVSDIVPNGWLQPGYGNPHYFATVAGCAGGDLTPDMIDLGGATWGLHNYSIAEGSDFYWHFTVDGIELYRLRATTDARIDCWANNSYQMSVRYEAARWTVGDSLGDVSSILTFDHEHFGRWNQGWFNDTTTACNDVAQGDICSKPGPTTQTSDTNN